MGRTLHYGIREKIYLSEEQKDALHELSQKYQKEYEWEWETVWFPPLYKFDVVENDKKKDDKEEDENLDHLVERIEDELDETGDFDIKVIRKSDVDWDDEDKLYGFTKVYGNEINAHNVIKFVVDASKILPDETFYFIDDADALYCPLLVKNGLAKPDVESIRRSIDYMKKNHSIREGGLWDTTNREIFYRKLIKEWEWTDIYRFVRPLKVTEEIKKKKKTDTINITEENVEDLGAAALDLLLDERLEQMKYYEDIYTFPEEI
ncbi:MAG: hypothetical protein EHM58_01120 [Ignavibacteriae bacterium]|nr:MAG: hypothetical protein EHM58_01120 [Ignavibacteriota bacterium]